MQYLLAYIEIKQFQKYLTKKMLQRGFDVHDIPRLKPINFPDNIPISQIILSEEEKSGNNNDIDSDKLPLIIAKIKALKLYNKYIRSDSEFEINIGETVKKELDDIFLMDSQRLIEFNINLKDLILLFKPVTIYIIETLTFSLYRFKDKPDFNRIISSSKSTQKIFAEITIKRN